MKKKKKVRLREKQPSPTEQEFVYSVRIKAGTQTTSDSSSLNEDLRGPLEASEVSLQRDRFPYIGLSTDIHKAQAGTELFLSLAVDNH